MAKRALHGDRTPCFLSKATLAAELDMSETTVGDYVRRGLLPEPIRFGGSVRWCWEEVQAHLSKSKNASGDDPFMKGVKNV